jgi:outer membrane protein OmpA-like peptidoglycan-associated protein
MRILVILLFFLNTASWGQKITGFWQGMLFSTTDETVLIPIYLDIYVTNGLVDGKIRIENKEGASVYPVVGKYVNNELELVTMKAMWYYLPEFSLSPYIYSLKYNPQNGYLEGSTDKQDYRLIAYQSKGEISMSKTAYLPKDWLLRFSQELKDGISAPQIRKQELLNFTFQPIYFDYDQATIRSEYQAYLKELIRMVKSHSDLRIEITGHTDADGSDTYNLTLSKRRSEALLLFFTQNGLTKDRVVISFKGEREPVDHTQTHEGKQRNRRVDFKFI